jgi:polysaccharide export outer membrane protein
MKSSRRRLLGVLPLVTVLVLATGCPVTGILRATPEGGETENPLPDLPETGPREAETPPEEILALTRESRRLAKKGFQFLSGDKIDISVFGHADLHTVIRVPRNLKAGFPMIGEVDFTEKTIRDMEVEIRTRLEAKHLHEAHVSILPLEFAERQVFITGEVKKNGAYAIPPFGTLTLVQLIALSGGFSENANRNRVKLIRETVGARREYILSYATIEKGGNLEADIYLLPGDDVMIPAQEKVYVLGSVNRPGGFAVGAERLTASKAIALAQGFTRLAAPSKTVVIRETEDGKKTTFKVPLSRILEFEATQRDLELRPGDVVFVPESLF